MSTRDQDTIVAFTAGAILGGLIGAGTALLLAPSSGRRTRRRLRRTAEEIGDRAGETLEHAADEAREAADGARRAAEESGDRVREKLEEGRSRLKF